MITSKDAKSEVSNARTVVESTDSTIEDKFKAILKVLEVVIKLALSSRLNVVKVMEKLGVEKIKPRTTQSNEKEETK